MSSINTSVNYSDFKSVIDSITDQNLKKELQTNPQKVADIFHTYGNELINNPEVADKIIHAVSYKSLSEPEIASFISSCKQESAQNAKQQIAHLLSLLTENNYPEASRFLLPMPSISQYKHFDRLWHIVLQKRPLSEEAIKFLHLLIAKGIKINMTPVEALTDLLLPLTEISPAMRDLAELIVKTTISEENINKKNRNGQTALFLTVEHELPTLTTYLLEQGAVAKGKTQMGGHTAFQTALIKNSMIDFATALYEKPGELKKNNVYGMPPIYYAAKSGKTDLMEFLLANGGSLQQTNLQGHKPIHVAMIKQQGDLAQWLFEHGQDINDLDQNNQTLLFYLNPPIFDRFIDDFLKSGLNINHINKHGATPLLKACAKQRFDTAEQLLKLKAKADIPDKDGFLPIHYVCLNNGSKELLLMLLKEYPAVNVKTSHGQTPLMFAILSDREDLVKILLEHKADAQNQLTEGKTALHLACEKEKPFQTHRKNQAAIANLLIAEGAKINKQDLNQNTPLHYAILTNNTQLIQLLLNKGANLSIPNSQNFTALDLISSYLLTTATKDWFLQHIPSLRFYEQNNIINPENIHESIKNLTANPSPLLNVKNLEKHNPLNFALFIQNNALAAALLRQATGEQKSMMAKTLVSGHEEIAKQL